LRARARRCAAAAGASAAIVALLGRRGHLRWSASDELMSQIMTRKMLLGIRDRAESSPLPPGEAR
jgi:hypothetical protein